MIDLDSDLLILHDEFHVTGRSWRGKARNVLVEFYALHWGFLSPTTLPLPTQKTRMDRKNAGFSGFCD
jgi:hypothetical protein